MECCLPVRRYRCLGIRGYCFGERDTPDMVVSYESVWGKFVRASELEAGRWVASEDAQPRGRDADARMARFRRMLFERFGLPDACF